MACTKNVLGTPGNNLVYLNKIYYNGEAASCPIIFDLNTCTSAFEQRFIVDNSSDRCVGNCGGGCQNCGCGCGCGCGCSCNCGCNNFELTSTTQFTVTNSCAVITSITPYSSTSTNSINITVDGFPVTSVQYQNGKFMADLSEIMSDITKCPCEPVDLHICDNYCHSENCYKTQNCISNCDNDGHFFLAEVSGPWNVEVQITLEGIASNEGQSCRFKLCCKTMPDTFIQIPGNNNFALNCVDIPCKSNGISPYMSLDFSACAILLNPSIRVSATSSGNQLTLTANMIITPSIGAQVLRPALFSLNALEVKTCCDDVGQCDPCLESNNCNSCGGCGDVDNCDDNSGCECNNPSPGPLAYQFCGTNGYAY